MSKEVHEYARRAEEARKRAKQAAGEFRELMEAIAEAYELLAIVQTAVDDPEGFYEAASNLH